jgi:hypothetical protein
MKQYLYILIITCLLAACTGPQVPEQYAQSKASPRIYPDYQEVTVPVNVAPLNFELLGPADEVVVRFSAGEEEIVCDGPKARPDIEDWKTLTAKAKGQAISVEVFARDKEQWTRFKPFNIYVSPDSIDPWISYRLISPSYVSYEELTLNQRCLETFDEEVFVDNMLCSTESGGQCVNCHNFQQYNPDRMQFHARQTHGGTLIAYDGELEKIDMNNDSLISAGVYPAWHPTMKLIAYSTNKTLQCFHTSALEKIEVLDAESDLILYDIDRHEVTTIEQQPNELEIFPCWAPDGKTLYFCSAHFEYEADSVDMGEIMMRAQEVKYNIYRKTFDPQTKTFGPRELVFDAAATDSLHPSMSATFPRISPDGRWLLFTLGEWGCFHIWHHDADLWIMDLNSGKWKKEGGKRIEDNGDDYEETVRPLDEINSIDTESYHSWSSNGRWIIFSSRRYDGVFTRPFIAHIDAEGRGSKPFELPMRNPDVHRQFLKSYNVPEFMKGRVSLTPQQVASIMKEEGTPITYKSK